jgi:hypothetical protein
LEGFEKGVETVEGSDFMLWNLMGLPGTSLSAGVNGKYASSRSPECIMLAKIGKGLKSQMSASDDGMQHTFKRIQRWSVTFPLTGS